MTRSTWTSRTLGPAALACLFGCAFVALAAQSEWKQITPVDRGAAMNGPASPTPSRSMRFIFEYSGDRVRVVQQTPVDLAMTTPPPAADATGVFVDVRDANEHTLARVAAPEALSASREIFPERHDQPITRADNAQPAGAFTVVVPLPAAADHVTIVRISHASERDPARPRVVDLVSFPLKTS